MFLPKILNRRRWSQFGEIFTWLAFISIVLILTNAMASLDKVIAYSFQPLSILLTYGWILFCALLEALALAVAVELAILLIDYFFGVDLSAPVRILLAAGLILTLVIMVAIIFFR